MPESDREPSLTSIAVEGFKSIRDRLDLEFRPLTFLAGANSSGKSSALQPLLLIKQTLDASFDPGPLLLHGPNVKFSQVDQMIWKAERRDRRFSVILSRPSGFVSLSFAAASRGIELFETRFGNGSRQTTLRSNMSAEDLAALEGVVSLSGFEQTPVEIVRDRCAFSVKLRAKEWSLLGTPPTFEFSPLWMFREAIGGLIHLLGHRGNPNRTYPTTQVGPQFPGTFEPYVASVLASWKERDEAKLRAVGDDLRSLGLTWKIEPKPVDDTSVELQVGRLRQPSRGGAHDLVNIADVGFGVSQALPVVVALQVAQPGQIVYVEQPEIHLHPRAQVAMASLLANAARRGAVVIAETHSEHILLAVQALVATGDLEPRLVKLHWFERDNAGVTRVKSADLDTQGAYGDWPLDFADVRLDVERRYLDANLGTSS